MKKLLVILFNEILLPLEKKIQASIALQEKRLSIKVFVSRNTAGKVVVYYALHSHTILKFARETGLKGHIKKDVVSDDEIVTFMKSDFWITDKSTVKQEKEFLKEFK